LTFKKIKSATYYFLIHFFFYQFNLFNYNFVPLSSLREGLPNLSNLSYLVFIIIQVKISHYLEIEMCIWKIIFYKAEKHKLPLIKYSNPELYFAWLIKGSLIYPIVSTIIILFVRISLDNDSILL